MSEDFLSALHKAQELPDAPEAVAKQVPDLLAGSDGQQRLVRRIGADEEGKVAGGKEFSFEFQCARLTVGNVTSGFSNGQPVLDELDESDRLKEIMDKSLRGEAIINKKETTFLKDGTVVIWVEWMEPKTLPPKSERDYLTTAELLDPEPSKRKREDDSESSSDSDGPSPDTDEEDDADAVSFMTTEEQDESDDSDASE